MKMLPRLQAEERLGAVDVALLGAGGFEQHDASRMLSGLRDQAAGQSQRRGQKANSQQLGGMGIGVTVVPAPIGAPGDAAAGDG